MLRLLKTNIFFFLICFGFGSSVSGQSWKPAMKGINLRQGGNFGSEFFHLDFKTDGPMNKDWVYGGYFDEDSLRRCVAYREGGRWVPLPFHGYKSNKARDIVMFGDTLYIGGSFGNLVLDKDTSLHLPNTTLLKWYNDSLWAAPQGVNSPSKMSAKGDSLLIWGASYFNPPNIVYFQFMTPDGGATWQYPYSIIHPTDSIADFGARSGLRILDNGDILTINNGSSGFTGYRGLNRWDGLQWHTYGSPIFAPNTWVNDFEFYNGDLYMGGTFSSQDFPAGPTDFVGHWDGTKWEDLATGITAPVVDLFVHDSILYCSLDRTLNPHYFGDVEIPYLAGWDGDQWCGTPANFEIAPITMGIINDTLYATFYYTPSTINGDTVSYMNYYDGDYLHGPGSICSTLGIGKPEEVISEPALKIYPNPVEDVVRISISRGELKELKMYNVSGNLLMQIKPDLNLKELEVDLSSFIAGVYHLQINDKHHVKLIKY